MKKRLLLTMMLLASLVVGAAVKANAANTPKAIWCAGNTTLYFLCDDVDYNVGDAYGTQTITNVWNGLYDLKYHNYRNTVKDDCTTVIIDEAFQNAGLDLCNDMFWSFRVLESVTGLRYMITESTTYMSSMFSGCSKLTTIDFTGVNTSNVTTMSSMFLDCSSLTALDLSSFNTSKVTSMSSMFNGCSLLTTLDLSTFNTSGVLYMGEMFRKCSALREIDLRCFNVSKVTNMNYMFTDDKELVTIFSNNDWNHADPAIASECMFDNCPKLVGAVAYNSSNKTVNYANPTTGYFTYRYPVALTFPDGSNTATVGTAFTGPTLTITSTDPVHPNPMLTVTYSSSDESVATVDASTGIVTPLISGTITITATFEGTIHYEPQSASYELTVSPKTLGRRTALCGVILTSDHINVPGKLETDLGANLVSGSVALTANEDYSVLTLTLTDAKLSTKAANFIYNQWKMNIILVGDNEVSSTKSSAIYNHIGPMTVSGTGKLTISGSYGIYNNGSMIQNGGTLNVTGRQSGLYGSSDNFKYTINDGVLIVTGGSEASICCKQATGQLILGTGVTITQPYGAQWENQAVCDADGNPIKTQVTIAKGAAACGLAYSKASETVAYGSTTALPTLTNPHSLPVTYSSSNTAVATVAADGKVTLVSLGTATITALFDGSAAYQSGIASYELKVIANTVSTPTITLSETSYTYDGTAKTPAVVSVKDGETVIPATEYTVGYSNNTNAGTATVTITDVEGGNYIVSGSTTFSIAPKTVSSPTITLSETRYTFDGTAKTPTVVSVKDGEAVIAATEYTVGYSNNTNVGTATVTIADVEGGNYIVSGSTTFSIAAADGSLTPPHGKSGLTYTGVAQDLITAGSSTTGTVQYSLDGTNYSTTIPQGTDAKEYTIYYKVVAKSGYEDVDPQSFKVSIAKKEVTVTAKDATKVKGSDDPELTYDVVGLVGSDKLTGALSRQAGEDIGVYAITQGTLKASDNYTLTFVGAKLTIYLKGDANGDNKVNVADIVEMVKAGKPQTDIDEVVKIIMGSNE